MQVGFLRFSIKKEYCPWEKYFVLGMRKGNGVTLLLCPFYRIFVCYKHLTFHEDLSSIPYEDKSSVCSPNPTGMYKGSGRGMNQHINVKECVLLLHCRETGNKLC